MKETRDIMKTYLPGDIMLSCIIKHRIKIAVLLTLGLCAAIGFVIGYVFG